MNYVITGGSGLVGTALTQALLERGDSIQVLSRRGRPSLARHDRLVSVKADTTQPGKWQEIVAQSDAVINLAGCSVFHLWNASYKDKIYTSRVLSTKNVVAAMQGGGDCVLLSASAAGFYGNGGSTCKDEEAPPGHDFLAEVCRDWEQAALQAETKGIRVVTMRFGVVLAREGGALAAMKLPYLLGLGGPIGTGKQYFPWIHIDDLVQAILFLLDTTSCKGPCNMVAPQAVRQKEFARSVAHVLRRPAFFPAPGFLVKSVLGEFGTSILQGQYLLPKKLQDHGFLFRYSLLEDAVKDLFLVQR